MKKALLLLTLIISIPLMVNAQMILDNFDAPLDTTAWSIYGNDDPNHTYLRTSVEATTVHEGTGALRIEWQDECYDQWGGWIGLTNARPDSGMVYDFSLYKNISLWYYNEVAQSKSGEVEFRIILNDAGPGTSEGNYEIWLSHHWILDDAPGWHHIEFPMEDVGMMSSEGFWNPGWGQSAEGNGILDLDKIKGWTLEFSQGNSLYQQPDDTVSGVIILDEFALTGVAPVNLVFFNGVANPGNVTMHTGWSGTATITDEEAYTPGTKSVKWSGGSAWDAVNFDLNAPRNLMFNWSTDSIQFKIKAQAGIGDLNLFFWDVDNDTAKADYAFQATYTLTEASMGYDGTWKEVKIPLRDFNRFAGVWDNDLGQTVPGEFDSTQVAGFAIGNTGQAIATDIYFDDIWTGNPEFDWEPPAQVTGVGAAPGDLYNLVFWTDLADETGETYNVYASTSPITDTSDPAVEVVATGVAEGTGSVTHYLYYPLQDKNITYYYAVECVDASGNVGDAGVSDAITNKGKGVPTIANHAPAGFAADGNFDEWANIMPWTIKPSLNNVAAGSFDNDDDLTATVYLAMDDDYLYVAADVIDNVYTYDPAMVSTWWTQDAFEFFIGLWDQNGKAIHNSTPENSRGTEPDYKLIFLKDRYYNEYKNSYLGVGNDPELTPDDPNYFFTDYNGADYSLEAKIALDSIAFGDDARFHPKNGMRIMFDLVFHDNDGNGGNNNLSWSQNNRDLAYLDQHQWTHTWIGDTTVTGINDKPAYEVVNTFALNQNYPNPFNPTTMIQYSLATNSRVTLTVYNILGQEIKTLVNAKQTAGVHQVAFDAHNFTSGVYFYQIKAGNFVQTKKMLLVK